MSRSATRTSALALIAALAVALAGAPAAAQRPTRGEDDSAALVDEGRAALRAGKLAAAAEALDQAIALNPRRVEAYVLRSAVHAARKQHRAGVALMRRAYELAPGDEDVLTALGSQLVLAGAPGDGVPLLEQVVARNPKRYDAQLLLGHHRHAAGAWSDAIAALEAYFQHRPRELAGEDARHRIELADAYLRARRPGDALAGFERALAEQRPRGDLRARLGVAWATAAIDCRRARPLLRELEPVAPAHPEVWLVDGQCALALGDPGGALALGRRYLERARGGAAGHALIGEAHAARGDLADARSAFARAREVEPGRRRWTVRLAAVLRRAGDPAGALAELERLGPPARPADDADWWAELGEALLARRDPAEAARRLAPVIGELREVAAVRVVLGAAQLAAGDGERAVATLGEAEAIASTPRGKQLLADALVTVAVARMAGDPAAAEQLLVRAEQLAAGPLVWRNLGVARLALDRPADALAVLERAAEADPSPITQMLAARARAATGDVAGARPRYRRALAAGRAGAGAGAVDIALDWAASELAGGDPAIAVRALEQTAAAAAAQAGPLARRHRAALVTARHAAGLAALRAGDAGRAVELLRAAAADEPARAIRCDLALATVVAGDPAVALAALKAASGQSCPFPSPADTQAVPILIAFTEGLTARRPARSLDRLTALTARSTGAAAALLGIAIRVVALEAAQQAYRAGQLAPARRFLQTARAASVRLGDDDVAHNLAVLDLAAGKLDAAIAQLERLAGKLPDALVNLGLAYERRGEPYRALDAWRRARRAGSRFAPLAEWIESKQRVYGDPP